MLLLRGSRTWFAKLESGSCATCAAWPPSASCFGFVSLPGSERGAGRLLAGPAAPNYIRARATVVKPPDNLLGAGIMLVGCGRRVGLLSRQTAARRSVGGGNSSNGENRSSCRWTLSFRKPEAARQDSPLLNRSAPGPGLICKTLHPNTVWYEDCSIPKCSRLAPPSGAKRRTSGGD